MKTGDRVELKMKKILRADDVFDGTVHVCNLLRFSEKEECLYLKLEKSLLSEISLDAIYECHVWTEDAKVSCTGRVTDRCRENAGDVLKLQIENGFYKININSLTNKSDSDIL